MLKFYSKKIVAVVVGLLCSNVGAFDITSEKVTQDKDSIKKHIFQKMADDIATSESWWVKAGAYKVQISDDVYNSRPLEFFHNKKEAKKFFKGLIDDVETAGAVQKKIEKFIDQKDSNSNENLGSFLFGVLVDNLKIEEIQKNEFKQNPAWLNEFIKTQTGSVRDEYFKINVANCIVHHYLTHHYNELKKHHGK